MEILDKVVVVTGGASGLGRATADHLVNKQKAKVAIFDPNEKAGKAAVVELGADNAVFCKTDITDENSVDEAVRTVLEGFGAIHVCINTIGIPTPCSILDDDGIATRLTNFAIFVNVNLIGLFSVMSKCAEEMAQNEPDNEEERGVIINISSGTACDGQIGQCAYSAFISDVLGLSMPASRELARYGIRVNAIYPGLLSAPLAPVMDQKSQDLPAHLIEYPNRLRRMENCAHSCVFLIENAHVNGRTIHLDATSGMHV